ncbi:hypothetical protein GJ744_011607 [Endocarpon pusillum]|uniref:Phosphatidylinositol-specific phospholipase C X domain-containing protein n=1 Tax=Endocarpon pusillum TaxID=364733 RepID=A0A8H7AK36_9EURO|nr:hypothetical protein GJ744_011607 [Endocarpon pusillum]
MQCLAVLAALLALTSAAVLEPRQTTACNNSPDLCSKSYSAITHLGAHNSPFLRDASTSFSTSGNHYFNSTIQLDAGVRMLTAQVHRSDRGWRLCHTSCDLMDAGLLSDWLGEVKIWMDNNPSDVVSLLLVNSDNATPGDLATEFTRSGITKYSYTPPSSTAPQITWPTLQDLISANTRLMTFVASLTPNQLDSTNAYLMDEFTFIFETAFDNTDPSNFTCTADRPSSLRGRTAEAVSSGRMPLQNHFLYDTQLFGIEAPDEVNITSTNAPADRPGNMGDAADACRREWAKPPVFILVDFFDQGPAIATVDRLNNVTNPIGRTPPPARDTMNSGASSSRALPLGLVTLVNQVKNGANPTLGAWIWAAADWSKTLGGWDTSP